MKLSDLDTSKTYSYADYFHWDFQERTELIRGQLFLLPSGNPTKHQQISGRLFLALHNFCETKDIQFYTAPFDVRLPEDGKLEDDEIFTVVQPDLCIVCDSAKLDDRGCLGAPDLVIEILSPGNSKREMREKYEIYEASGVKEYWLINYQDNTVFVYILNTESKFIGLQPCTEDQVLNSHIFPDLKIDLAEIFRE